MTDTPYTRFRLGTDTLADLDALAASAGTRTQALREAVARWRLSLEEAGRQNALEFGPADWTRLAHLNQPDPLADMPDEAADGLRESMTPAGRDWSRYLALELVQVWEGRDALPVNTEEARECRELAGRVAALDAVRGYALMACLRYFWRHPEAGVGGGDWWHPETWLAADAPPGRPE